MSRTREKRGRDDVRDEWDELAEEYHDLVITPFARAVEFRLPRDLREWLSDPLAPPGRVVVDFGCGCGEALALVAGRVSLAAGIDRSEAMLQATLERLRDLDLRPVYSASRAGTRRLRDAIDVVRERAASDPECRVLRGDLLDLGPLAGQVDLALAINSICPATRLEAEQLFASIAGTVRGGGALIAVFPSLDTMEHLFSLWNRAGEDPREVGRIVADEGLFISAGGEQQKYFDAREIEALFEASGLRLERLEKIYYPWNLIRESGWGNFPRQERVWDWYAVGVRGSSRTCS